jgi:hypothetical protein
MCETRRVFLRLKVAFQWMCLGITEIQILVILKLRFQLVDARNDRTGKQIYPLEIFQKVKNERSTIKIS